MKMLLVLGFIIVLVLASASTSLAAETVFLDKIEETRGFTNVPAGLKCNEYYATGTAQVGDRKCDYAYFNTDGDSVVRYVSYDMKRNGRVKFRVHRNSINTGWSFAFLATIRKRDGSSVVRIANTGLVGNRGGVNLWRGERLLRIELQAHSSVNAKAPAKLFTFHVWTMTWQR